MNIQEKKRHFLNLLESAEERFGLHQQKCAEEKGFKWITRKLEKLLRYKGRYLKFVLAKIFGSFTVKARLWFGRKFITYLPSDRGIVFFGILADCEIKLTKFLIKNLSDNSIFYDIGAHHGFFSVSAEELISDGEIHAFEPVPRSFNILKKNLSKDSNIFLNNKALFSRQGKIDFYEAKNIFLSGSDTFNPNNLEGQFGGQYSIQDFNKISVETTTLDKYCQDHKKPTFLKIDVEGSKQHVIEGGIEVLRNNQPVIAMEVWSNKLNNESQLRAAEHLYRLGYKSYKIKDDGDIEYVEKIDPARDINQQFITDNFIFKKHV